MTFVKGKSGNPLGLSSEEVKLKQTIRKLAGKHAPAAIARLAELMHSEESNVCASACNAILDRSVGKASQPVDVQGDVSISVKLTK